MTHALETAATERGTARVATVPVYFAHVEGLRATAVLAVLLYHLSPGLLPGGFMGVDVFFVISGFVVTASLAGHRSEGAGDFLALFYSRRLARLVPALVTVLVTTTALYVLFVPRAWFNRAAESVGQSAFWGISNWTLDRHVVNYFEPGAEFNPFTHTWSLGVEEQFYLIAPLFLFVALGSQFSAKRHRLATLGIVVLAMASQAACYYYGITRGSRFVFYNLAFRFWELAAGVVLYLVGRRITRLGPAAASLYRWSGWVGLALVAASMLLPRPEAYPYFRSTLAVLGALLLIGLPAVERQDRLNAVLASRAAIWIGHRSYALYLWHWPIYVLARWTTGLSVWPFNLLAVLLTFAAAAASYRLVENPVRYSPRLKQWRPAVRITTFLLVLGAGWLAGRTLLENQPVLGLGQATRHAADWYGGSDLLKTTLASVRQCEPTVQRAALGSSTSGQTTYLPAECVRRIDTRLFVIGDSHAHSFHATMEQLSAEQGRTVTVLESPGCSYIDLMAPIDPARDERCHRQALAAQQAVLQLARPGDIVFLSSLRLPRLIENGGKRREAARGPGGALGDVYTRSATELAGIHLAAEDAPRWFKPFLDAGLRVIFEMPKPILRVHPFQCVDWFNRNNPDCAAGLSERRADQERYRTPVVEVIHRLVAVYPGVSAWDPLPALCEASHCNALMGGRPLFFDGDHVSPFGNLVLLPSFRSYVHDLQLQ